MTATAAYLYRVTCAALTEPQPVAGWDAADEWIARRHLLGHRCDLPHTVEAWDCEVSDWVELETYSPDPRAA